VLLRLLPGEAVVGAAGATPEGSVLLATAQGQLKRLAVESLRRCQRGDLGQIGLRFSERGDQLVDLRPGEAGLVAALCSDGRSIRLSGQSLETADDRAAGTNLSLSAGARVVELVLL